MGRIKLSKQDLLNIQSRVATMEKRMKLYATLLPLAYPSSKIGKNFQEAEDLLTSLKLQVAELS